MFKKSANNVKKNRKFDKQGQFEKKVNQGYKVNDEISQVNIKEIVE